MNTIMTIALTIIYGLLMAVLVIIQSLRPKRSTFSDYELRRRKRGGEDVALDALREKTYGSIMVLRYLIRMIVVIFLVPTLVVLFGWVGGIAMALLSVIAVPLIARQSVVARYAHKLYAEQERSIMEFCRSHRTIFTYFSSRSDHAPVVIASKDELEHIVDQAKHILSDDERRLLIGSIHFEDHAVGSIMTQKDRLFTIKKTEILGPLVLDDLHRSGHDSFPVVDSQDGESIVGILRLRDVQTLDTTRKHTAKVETAMDPDVRSINQGQSLLEALNVLIDSQHHLLIVTDDTGSTVGIITLRDIIKTLFGR